jgi:hypothetical protein
VAFELPVVDPASLSAWCELHLGSPAAGELFRAGHLACVIGARLADGRKVVVKVRPAAPRTVACIEVQRRLFESGYPCPRPLAGPASLGEYEATAESYVSGEVMLPASGRAARPFAAALAQMVALAPSPEEVSSLRPTPRGRHGTTTRAGCGPGPRTKTWT